jgi:hypothetical protein
MGQRSEGHPFFFVDFFIWVYKECGSLRHLITDYVFHSHV